jgi:uncharacterized protein YqgV (UPF0045/DUF77 family)
MILEIECLPTPPGTADDPYRHIEAAIAVVQASGLHHEVSALGTTVEGTPDEVWAVARAVHEACLHAGAGSVVSVLKVAESAGDGLAMDALTRKFR